MQGYHACIEAALGETPRLGACLFSCVHCGISFFSDPRNSGEVPRVNLRCPFGCREAHRKAESTKRSTAYYRTTGGRDKKRTLNQRRYESLSGPTRVSAPASAPAALRSNGSVTVTRLLPYLCLVLTLIEDRPVTEDELRPVLERISRQRRCRDFRFQEYISPGRTDRPP
jgi:hypothetical protein